MILIKKPLLSDSSVALGVDLEIDFVSCPKCKTENAGIQTKGIEEKVGHRPFYRYQCKSCNRVTGILID